MLPLAGAAITSLGNKAVKEALEIVKRAVGYAVIMREVKPYIEEISFEWMLSQMGGSEVYENIRSELVDYFKKHGLPVVLYPKEKAGVRYEQEITTAEMFTELIKKVNVDIAKKSAALGIVDPWWGSQAARIFNAVIWSLGLGWLSWVSLSPVLDLLIATPTRNALMRKFRLKTLSESEAEEAYRRLLIDEKTLDEVYKELGYPDDIIAVKKDLITKILPESKLEKLYKLGRISKDLYIVGLTMLGYAEPHARLLADIASMEKTEKERDLTKSEILKGYKVGMISRENAKQMLQDLGYTADEAEFILTVQDISTEKPRELTPTQVLRAYREGIIKEEECKRRLQEMGYVPEDINILIRLYGPRS